MIGNEADVVECFVRHTLTLVDRLVVILHRSVDGTAEIVRALQTEGLPVSIEPARYPGFSQGAEISHAAKSLLSHSDPAMRADYVVPLDADEFLKPPSREYLYRALSAVPGKYYGAARWLTYLPMRPDDLQNPHVLRAFTHCRQDNSEAFYKVFLHGGFSQESAHVVEGTHCVVLDTPEGQQVVPRMELKAMRLAHFPVRSPFQMARKAYIGAFAKKLKSDATIEGLGTHWQGLLEQVEAKKHLAFEQLRSVAFHYPQTFEADAAIDEAAIAYSPIDCDFELRYSQLMRTDLDGILADWAAI